MSIAELPPAILVTGREDAVVALAAARSCGVPVTLATAPAAAAVSGPQWFRRIVALALSETACAPRLVEILFDCGRHAGLAANALRAGLPLVRVDPGLAVLPALAGLAAATSGRLLAGPAPDLLDLRDHDDPSAAARGWIAGAGP